MRYCPNILGSFRLMDGGCFFHAPCYKDSGLVLLQLLPRFPLVVRGEQELSTKIVYLNMTSDIAEFIHDKNPFRFVFSVCIHSISEVLYHNRYFTNKHQFFSDFQQ